MKRGFLTAAPINGNGKGPTDVPADKIGPDACKGSEGKAHSPRAVPPPPPQEPLVANVTSSSATVRWQVAVPPGLPEGDRGNDSPSRPGREPTGGSDDMSNDGQKGDDDKHSKREKAVPHPPQLFKSSVVFTAEAAEGQDGKAADAHGEASEVGGTWRSDLFDGAGGFEADLSCLEPGHAYSLFARIHTKEHGDIDGATTSFSTAPSHPARPEPPVMCGKGKNLVKLRWTAPNGHGAAVAQYEVEIRNSWGSDGGKGSPSGRRDDAEGIEMWGCGVQVHQGPETRCEIKGLRPGSSLQARVRAFNSIGASLPSAWVTVNTAATVPAPPPRPFVGQGNIGNLFFCWHESEDNGGAAIEAYCLEVDDGEGDGFMVRYNGPERQWLLSNTVCGHPYKVRVKATNATGSSPFSEVLEVQGMCGPPNPPGPPDLMEFPPGMPSPGPAFALCLTWAPPDSDNGSRIQMYQVVMRRLVDGMPVEFFQVVYAGADTWCQVQGLYPASFYEFGLVAVSLLGTSAPSPTAIFSTAGAPPGPPPPPFLLGVEGGNIHVGWTLPDVCNGSPVTSFVLESLVQDETVIDEATGQPGGWVSSVQYQGSGISHWIKGLSPGVAVWLRVAGINAHGQGCFSAPANVMTPCAVPQKVAKVSAFATGPGKACVHWEPPASNGGTPITGYKVFIGRKGVGGSEPILLTVEGPGPAVAEGLLAGSLYQAKVQAMNRMGHGEFSDPVVFSSEAGSPSAPKMPAVTHVGNDRIGLSWAQPAHDNGAAVEAYTLEMQETSATVSAEGMGGGKSGAWKTIYQGSFLAFEAGSLRPGGLYRFRVRGRNSAGDGPFSPPLLASTEAVAPGPPLALSVVGVTAKELKLKWSAPAFDGGSEITSYAVQLASAGVEREVWRGGLTSCKVKVAPDAVYTVLVTAYSVIGPGTPSIALTVSTPAAVSVPVKPRLPPAMPPPTFTVKGQGLAVSWSPCRDSQPPVFAYHLSAEPDDGCAHGKDDADPCAHEELVCYSGGATSTEIRDLQPGVSYRLRVCAENDVGQGPWSPAAVLQHKLAKPAGERKALRSRPLPPAPVDLALERATRTSLRVAWQPALSSNLSSAPGAKASRRSAALENGKETYTIELAEGSGAFEVVGQDVEHTRFTVTKLVPGSRYRVRVQAHTQKRGASSWSDEALFRTLPGGDSAEAYWGYIFMVVFSLLLSYVVFVLE